MTLIPATILIVDDEALNRKLLEALLQPEGYVTVSVASGEEALALIAQRPPDLVLLDVRMPGMDGYQVATTLKANPATAHIPIIMVTAQVDRASRVVGLDAGAEEFLSKPVDRAELWLRVRNLLRLKAATDQLKADSAPYSELVQQARIAELERFRAAMDSAADGIVLVRHATMRYIDVNATACNLLGASREELLLADPAQTAGVASAQLKALFAELIAGPSTRRLIQSELRREDGATVTIESHWQGQRAGAEWVMVGVLRDISVRAHADRAIA